MQTKTLALFFAFIGGASAICNSPGDSRLAGPLRSRPFGQLVQPSLRGGGASQPPKRVKQSYTQQAVDFFGSERIPASFLAGTSLSLLFAFPLADDDAPHLQASKRMYLFFAAMAFCNELIAVVVCSLGIGRLYLNQHDPMATSAIGMMLREVASFSMRDHRNVQVPLFFLAARTHFLSGLLCVAFALSVRMWAEYESYCRPLALGLTFTLQATWMFMLSLFNFSLTRTHFSSFTDMWLTYVQLILVKFTHHASSLQEFYTKEAPPTPRRALRANACVTRNPFMSSATPRGVGPIAVVGLGFAAAAMYQFFQVMLVVLRAYDYNV